MKKEVREGPAQPGKWGEEEANAAEAPAYDAVASPDRAPIGQGFLFDICGVPGVT